MTTTTADGALEPERNRAWLKRAKPLALAWLLLVLGYFCWEGFWYTGLYAALAEWEHARYDWYSPVGNFSGLVLLFGAPPIVIVKLIERAQRHREPPPIVEERTAGLRAAAGLARWLAWAAGGLAVATLVSVLLIFIDLPGDSGTPQQLSAVANRFQVREGVTQVEFASAPKRAILFRMRWPGELIRTSFAQVESKLANGQKITLFAELSSDELGHFAHDGVSNTRLGILVRNGLPGTTVSYLNGAGIHVANPYYVLYRSALSSRLRYLAVSVQLATGALVIFLFWIAQRLRVRDIRRRMGTSAEPAVTPN
ncbi:hypothetical protein [Sphingomonas sp. dw_22]|uniref:hypothetical protein n=1 Tax=Sphingomonas sp. dw_22 TaxID=2721175 RepID=UPI001BD1BF88|nr:hypothetical protein [Sphingomonas sp. dw_22]